MIGREEAELVVTYSVTPGRPETGPTYSCGGTPAEPDEVEIVSIKHNGQPVTLSDEEEEALWRLAALARILPRNTHRKLTGAIRKPATGSLWNDGSGTHDPAHLRLCAV
jgi:hypothetical protein